ncbi:MAG: hydrogenase expression/formation protein HypC [Ilumatobacteraceae bacterium]|nr:hydrogenase expression/formation protein HypC [Ilumatobacteraceae bacterium]
MCLGIPGQIVETNVTHEHLARVEVNGVGRVINVALLEDEHQEPGDWELIHVGFAMSKVDEEEANLALASLQMMGEMFTDEVDALMTSPSTTGVTTRGVSEQWE